MNNYRNISIFMEEETVKALEERLEKSHTFLDCFINAFLHDLVNEPEEDEAFDRYMTGCARTYYKAYTNREWQ